MPRFTEIKRTIEYYVQLCIIKLDNIGKMDKFPETQPTNWRTRNLNRYIITSKKIASLSKTSQRKVQNQMALLVKSTKHLKN
jgi:hypothetical protein